MHRPRGLCPLLLLLLLLLQASGVWGTNTYCRLRSEDYCYGKYHAVGGTMDATLTVPQDFDTNALSFQFWDVDGDGVSATFQGPRTMHHYDAYRAIGMHKQDDSGDIYPSCTITRSSSP
jgi:hypothetical protein